MKPVRPASGLSVPKSGRPVSSRGTGRRLVRNLPMTARENYGYFFSKTGLSVRFKILSIWVAAPNAPSTELHRKVRQNAAERGRPEAKNLESIKGRLESL